MIVDNGLAAFDDYLRYGTNEEREKEDSTRADYVYTARIFLTYAGDRPITADLAKAFIKDLEQKGNKASSINRHLWALKSYFRFLAKEAAAELRLRSQELPAGTTEVGALRQQVDQMREEQRIRDFADLQMHGLRKTKYQPKFLRDEEWKQLYEFTKAPLTARGPEYNRYRARLEFALLMAYCGAGLRCSEAISLRKEDIHASDGYIRIIGKGDKEDFVPVEPEVIEAIEEYVNYVQTAGWLSQRESIWVFPGKKKGTHLSVTAAEKIIKDLCRRAGFPEMHVHGLRHTAGYQLRKGGAEERDIQDFMRHESINTTKIYTGLVTEDLQKRLPRRFGNGNTAK